MINIDTRLLPDINEKELWLLVMIAKRFDAKMSSYPSNQTLMKDTGWGVDKLRAVKLSLHKKGILNVEDRFDKKGKQTSNLYSVDTQYLSVFVNLSDKGVGKSEGCPVGKSEGGGVDKSNPEVLTNEVLTNEKDMLFNEFWNAYDKKVGKVKSQQLWQKLTLEEKELAISYIPSYKNSREKKYMKDPERFIKNKTWNDEIVTERAKEDVKSNRKLANNTLYTGSNPYEGQF